MGVGDDVPSTRGGLRSEYPVIPSAAPHAHVTGEAAYEALYARSLADPAGFWAELAREHLEWQRDFSVATSGSLRDGDAAWFLGGALNVSANCIDRHVATQGDKPAIIWESDEVGTGRTITFKQLQAETCRVANAMRAAGVRKGDTVAIYMPMIPETAFVMLACCRIGAVHRLGWRCRRRLCFSLRHADLRCLFVCVGALQRGLRGLLVRVAAQPHRRRQVQGEADEEEVGCIHTGVEWLTSVWSR